MHETIIAEQIIAEAKKQGDVKSITIEVGDLGHVPAEEFERCIKTLVPWRIIIYNKKATVKCQCGYVGEPNIIEKSHDHNLFTCPLCRKIPEILDGKDIILKQVVVK